LCLDMAAFGEPGQVGVTNQARARSSLLTGSGHGAVYRSG